MVARHRRPGALTAALNAACALLLACGGDDAGDPAAPIEPWPIPNTGGPLQGAGAGQGGSTAPPRDDGLDWPPFDPIDPGMQPEEDAGPPMEPDPALALLDPDEVYIFGTLSEDRCDTQAIAPVDRPDEALVGFDCRFGPSAAFVRPTDGRLIYRDRDATAVLAFHCDGCVYASAQDSYPQDPLANDEEVAAGVCPSASGVSAILDFKVGAGGDTLIRCADFVWYDERGVELPALAGSVPLSVGHQGTALLADGVLDLASGTRAPLTGLQDRTVIATRARADGYWIAAQPSDTTLAPELWLVAFDGTATLQGTYPALQPNQRRGPGIAIDGAGRLVHRTVILAAPTSNSGTIIRRSVDGDSEIIYDELKDPGIRLHGAALITGP